MKQPYLRNVLMGVCGLLLMGSLHAGIPLWTFAPVSGYPPSVTVSAMETAIIQYTVTNQSHQSHTLRMKSIQGITPSGCTLPLSYHQSCTLILSVHGNALTGNVLGGPVLCEDGNPNQCYQPAPENSLIIQLIPSPPAQQYTVTPHAGAHGSISPSDTQTVNSGATLTFTAIPNVGYGVNQWFLDGTLVQMGGTVYQLSNITMNHSLSVTFLAQPPIQQYTVSPFAEANGSISPSHTQTVNSGATLTFTALPNAGYVAYQWYVDNMLVQTGGETYQLTDITANHTINLTFAQYPIPQYTVTPLSGVNGSISPNTAQVVDSGATLTFTAIPNPGYGINQWLLDGTLVQTGGTTYQLTHITANHMMSVTFANATLTPSISTLALSINCLPSSSCMTTQNAALTGNARQIIIRNNGSLNATHVMVSDAGLPLGSSVSSNTCNGTLDAGSFCTITLTPGAVASPDVSSNACTSGTEPVAATVTVTADGGLSTPIDIYVLGYGCQYQGGFLYSVNDATPNTGNIGGKVVSLLDQAAPQIDTGPQVTSIIWSSNGQGPLSADVSDDLLPGIAETSTPSGSVPTYSDFQNFFLLTYTNTNPFMPTSFSACQGNIDGQCNTGNILTFYNKLITNYGLGLAPFTATDGPTLLADYAAGLSQQIINDYSGWYLPAICEMDAVSPSVSCPAGTQSMVSTLSFLLGDPSAGTPSTSCSPPNGTDCLAGHYWSSTVFSPSPGNVWVESFDSLSNFQTVTNKDALLGVRCSRALTL